MQLVVFFCLGTALIQLFFSNPLQLVDVNSTLTRVAGAFPTGATFFVSWQVIQMGFQISLEQALIGAPVNLSHVLTTTGYAWISELLAVWSAC